MVQGDLLNSINEIDVVQVMKVFRKMSVRYTLRGLEKRRPTFAICTVKFERTYVTMIISTDTMLYINHLNHWVIMIRGGYGLRSDLHYQSYL